LGERDPRDFPYEIPEEPQLLEVPIEKKEVVPPPFFPADAPPLPKPAKKSKPN